MTIITIGEPKLSFARDGFASYITRLGGYHKVQVNHLSNRATDEQVLRAIGEKYCVVLDEHGHTLSSVELAQFLEKRSVEGIGEMCFVIGGPDGHSDHIKERADFLWSLSRLTFPHDMAMLIFAETLYRASTIIGNHPYHRE